MRTEVYINDQLFDLEDESTVAATYGNITWGSLNKRKGVKSNSWRGPFSQRNKLIYESCEAPGSFSEVPYRKSNIRVDIDGVPVFEGFCILDSAEDFYEIQSFAGASDFYSTITNKKLSELDLSFYNHVWGDGAIIGSWSNTHGYIYAYVAYGKEIQSESFSYPGNEIVPPDYLLPQIFFHTVVKAIANDAGYTLMGDVLTSERFLKHLIIANSFPLPIQYGGTHNLSTLLPDMLQSKVWLDFANIYGLQFDINEPAKEIRANYIDDIIFNEAEDWSPKIDKSKRPGTKYKIDGYGQTNFLRFKKDPATDVNGCREDYAKSVQIDNTTLPPTADIYVSDFYLAYNDVYPNEVHVPTTKTFIQKNGVYSGVWSPAQNYPLVGSQHVWWNGTYYQLLQVSLNNTPSSSPAYWKPVAEKDIWEIKSRPMYGYLVTDLNSPMQVYFNPTTTVPFNKVVFAEPLAWPVSYDAHYRLFSRIIVKTKQVEMLVKLNYADVNQIDFTKAKKIDDEMYMLEEITQFKLNRKESTICNLIRI